MNVEQQVRADFEAQGLTAERLGGLDVLEVEIRAEVRRLELSQGSTPPGTTSSMATRLFARPLAEVQAEAVAKATDADQRAADQLLREAERYAGAECDYCADQRAIRLTRDPKDVRFGKSFPCPRCVPVEVRMGWAGIPQRYQAASVDSMQRLPGKAGAIRYVAEQWNRRDSIIIASRAGAGDSKWGTGKTMLACAMARMVLEDRRYPRFWYVPDLMDGIRSRFNSDALETADQFQDAVAREPFLILDDLGAERPTDWTRERLAVLLNDRYNAQRPTVVTTNYTSAEEIADAVGGAVASRLKTYQWLMVGGEDLRGGQ
jgi:hypothetical protein